MAYSVFFAIATLVGIILYQTFLLRRSRREHHSKMELLRELVLQLADTAETGRERIRLSDDMLQKLRSANIILSHDINEMVTISSKPFRPTTS